MEIILFVFVFLFVVFVFVLSLFICISPLIYYLLSRIYYVFKTKTQTKTSLSREHIEELDRKLGNILKTRYAENFDAILYLYLDKLFDDRSPFSRIKITKSYITKVFRNIRCYKQYNFEQYIVNYCVFTRKISSLSDVALNSLLNNEAKNIIHFKKIGTNVWSFSGNHQNSFCFIFSVNEGSTSILLKDIQYKKLRSPGLTILKKLSTPSNYLVALIIFCVSVCPYFLRCPWLWDYNYWVFNFLCAGYFILWPLINKIFRWLQRYINTKIDEKYSTAKRYSHYVKNIKDGNVGVLNFAEFPISAVEDDKLGTSLLAADLYYNCIHNSFLPNMNHIIIIDAKRGMGKTTLINFIAKFARSVKVVQISIKQFKHSFGNDAPIDEQNKALISLLDLIAQGLEPDASKLLKRLTASIDALDFQVIKFNLKNLFAGNTGFTALQNKLKRMEHKTLLIIEDLDRLSDYELRVFSRFLWFVHDLPFTLTLLPCEEAKLKKAFHDSDGDKYEELDEYKIFQQSFQFNESIYNIVSTCTYKIFFINSDKFSLINPYKRLANFYYKQTPDVDNNAWSKVLLKYIKNSGISDDDRSQIISPFHISDDYRYNLDNSIMEDIKQILKDNNVSIREWKYIMQRLRTGDNSLFFVQQVIFFILHYRFKDNDGVLDYLSLYHVNNRNLNNINFHRMAFSDNSKRNGFDIKRKSSLEQIKRAFHREELRKIGLVIYKDEEKINLANYVVRLNIYKYYNHVNFGQQITDEGGNIEFGQFLDLLDTPFYVDQQIMPLINLLENYPANLPLHTFIIVLFGFGARGADTEALKIASNVLCSEFVKGFLCNGGVSAQSIYDDLSLDWREQTPADLLNINKDFDYFVFAFNALAISVIINRNENNNQRNYATYNLFLYQKLAILLLQIISKNDEYIQQTLIQAIRPTEAIENPNILLIHHKLLDKDMAIDCAEFSKYLSIIFNIDYDTMSEYKTGNTRRNKIDSLKSIFCGDNTNPNFVICFDYLVSSWN